MGNVTSTVDRDLLEAVKISCFSRGITITPRSRAWLSHGGTELLTVREYPTTGGVTVELPNSVYLNAPFDEWYTEDPEAELDGEGDDFVIRFQGTEIPVVRVFPLPGYLDAVDEQGRCVTDIAMSHTDRIRVSPVGGCAYDCGFCDLPLAAYSVRPAEQVLAALDIAMQDEALPARHALISGGSPRRAHYQQFEDACATIVEESPIPMDIMMSPMIDGLSFIDRMVKSGVNGFAINLEVYSEQASLLTLGRKYRTTRSVFADFISEAVKLTGPGTVRSLIIPGLEPVKDTLEGVEFLAALGVDPVLSPFRPADDTELSAKPPISEEDMRVVLEESRSIVDRYDVVLGPRCLPCQHNTLTFPWDVV